METCKKFIGVDGCHLKTRFEEELLLVVAMNANNEIFPLTIAAYKAENKRSWFWFFSLLKEHMGFLNGMALAIMFDGQKGLIVAYIEHLKESKSDIVLGMYMQISKNNFLLKSLEKNSGKQQEQPINWTSTL